MSRKFNARGYRTVALSGNDSEEKRQEAFERLAMEESDATQEMQPLDFIFSRDILNEGVDIVEVNQVIMLRPTQSPIVFIQQLGRGLRKAPGKEYVVILDLKLKLDIENPIIRINTAFKGCSSLEKISVLPRIYHN